MNILKSIYYFLNSIRINVFNKGVRVSLSCKIRPKTKFDGYNRIGSHTILKGRIGRYSYIGANCELNAHIGSFCSIGPNVAIVSATHPLTFASTSPAWFSRINHCGKKINVVEGIENILSVDVDGIKYGAEIGSDVWIGSNVMIKGGVKIGTGAVVGMGSVVTKDVPPYSVVAGCPARVIKYRFDNELIKRLVCSEWWRLPDSSLLLLSKYYKDVEKFVDYAEKLRSDSND